MKLNNFSLQGKIALITGAAGLLGQQHAHALLESGATVILTDINIKSLEEAKINISNIHKDSSIHVFEMDVSSLNSIRDVLEKTKEEIGHVDILINNAAIDPKVGAGKGVQESSRFENFPIDSWTLQVNVGLTGSMLCSQVFGAEMAKRGSGVILNISSDLSVIAPDQRIYRQEHLKNDQQPVKPVTYSVIKHGLIGLTKYLASYWAEQGVRVNAISPGGIYNGQNEAFVEKLTNLIPMKRMANKDEYRSTVQYLCSDASSYMTGQNIVIDGGRSIL